eukprot:1669628-Pyramimonas_sp.AAC.1
MTSSPSSLLSLTTPGPSLPTHDLTLWGPTNSWPKRIASPPPLTARITLRCLAIGSPSLEQHASTSSQL